MSRIKRHGGKDDKKRKEGRIYRASDRKNEEGAVEI